MPYDGVIGDLIHLGRVEMRVWKDGSQGRQSRAFNHFVRSAGWGEDDYCAFIDPDEFIVFDNDIKVSEFIKNYSKFAGVGLSWRMYNASGRIKSDNTIPTIEAYTTEFDFYEPRIKIIARLISIDRFTSPHYFIPKNGNIVTTGGEIILEKHPKYKDFSNGHIKHYITKSWEDWIN